MDPNTALITAGACTLTAALVHYSAYREMQRAYTRFQEDKQRAVDQARKFGFEAGVEAAHEAAEEEGIRQFHLGHMAGMQNAQKDAAALRTVKLLTGEGRN